MAKKKIKNNYRPVEQKPPSPLVVVSPSSSLVSTISTIIGSK
jgi:hypothetical protein